MRAYFERHSKIQDKGRYVLISQNLQRPSNGAGRKKNQSLQQWL